ncbi:ABC transporter permease [Candidatus Parcubacteria bacterium]|nr:MAG: ABC transporter permease [Candidatus Parcubacteria bacterium]
MIIVSFYRVIKFAFQSFWRNFWLSMVTVTVIILTVISINFLLILKIVTDSLINSVQQRVNISIFFKQDIPEADVLEVKSYLDSLSQVNKIEYVSAEKALSDFKSAHQNDKDIVQSLEEIESNPLGAVLNVSAKKLDDYESILEVLDQSKYKELILSKNFDDHKNYINRINEISSNLRNVILSLSIVFVFISILIVINTIRIAIYTHSNEISIMKLVGASNSFIRSPFLIEAIFDGVISLVIAAIIIFPVLNLIQPYLTETFIGINFDIVSFFKDNFFKIFGLELLIISLISIVSSGIAVRRYLDV